MLALCPRTGASERPRRNPSSSNPLRFKRAHSPFVHPPPLPAVRLQLHPSRCSIGILAGLILQPSPCTHSLLADRSEALGIPFVANLCSHDLFCPFFRIPAGGVASGRVVRTFFFFFWIGLRVAETRTLLGLGTELILLLEAMGRSY